MRTECPNKQIFPKELKCYFNLRTPKSNTPTLIYLVTTINGKQFKLATEVKVYPYQWDNVEQMAKISRNYSVVDNNNNRIVNETIEKLITYFNKFKHYLCSNLEIINISQVLKNYIYKDNITMATKKEKHICATASLKLLVTKLDIKDSSKLQITRNIDKFSRWLNSKKIDDVFENMNISTINEYTQNLQNEGATPTTIKNVITTIITQLKRASKDDDNKFDYNSSKLDNWEAPKNKANKEMADAKKVTLTEKEIEKIYSYTITEKDGVNKNRAKELNEIKDLFVLQCLVGQRNSDINKLFDGQGTYNEDGSIITIIQQKGNQTANIPLSPMAKEIISKYKDNSNAVNYYTTNSRINKWIKQIMQIIGFKEKIKYQDEHGKNIECEKWELIHTHTARHSYITNMLRKGMNKEVLKSITGHSDTQMIDNVYSHLTNQDTQNLITKELEKINGEKNTNSEYIDEINEAKEVMAMFGADPFEYIDCYDVDELRSKMYSLEHQIIQVIGPRDVLKEIFNDHNKTLKEKANDLHNLYNSLKEKK